MYITIEYVFGDTFKKHPKVVFGRCPLKQQWKILKKNKNVSVPLKDFYEIKKTFSTSERYVDKLKNFQ